MANRKRARATSPKKELLRKIVLEAAARLFAERGFGGTNLQDLADELNISRPALYYYFKSKEDILASLIEEVTMFSVHQATQIANRSQSNPTEALRSMVISHSKWLLDHRIQFRVIDRTESNLPKTVQNSHDLAKRQLLDNFRRTIERGISLGHFRPVDPTVAAFSIIGMCSWTAWWFKSDGRLPAEVVSKSIADMAVASLKNGNETRVTELTMTDAIERLRTDVNYLEKIYGDLLGVTAGKSFPAVEKRQKQRS